MKKAVCFGLCVVSFAAASGCRAAKQDYVARGNKQFAAAEYEEASLNYRKAIQSDGAYGEAYYGLGLTSIKLNDGRRAYEALRRAEELLPQNVDAKEKFADVCLSFYLADASHPQKLYSQIKELSDELLAENGKSYEGLMLKGYLASTDRKPKEAIQFFRQALQVDQSNAGVVTELVHVLILDGEVQEGERLAMDLIVRQKTPYGPIYDLLYGFYLSANRFSEAENVLETKVDNNPRNADYILQLARHYNGRRQTAEMNGALQRLLDDPKDFPQARLWVGDFYLGLRDYTAAIGHYQEGFRSSRQAKEKVVYRKRNVVALLSAGKKDEALRLAEQVLTENPKDEGVILLHAGILLDSGKREMADIAAGEFRTVVSQHPDDALLRLQLARAYRLGGDLEAARSQLLEAINKKGDLTSARYELAEITLAQQPAEALHQANEILKVRPGDRRARLLRTSGLIGTGDGVSARAALAQLIQESPKDEEPQLQLGLLALAEHNYALAIDILSKHRGGGDTRVFAGLAIAYLNRNEVDASYEILGEGLKKSPGSPALLEQVADVEALTGQYDLAIAQFQQLLSRAPKSITLRRHLAEVYGRMGDRANEITYYQQAHELAPNDVTEALNLAGALTRAGRTTEARTVYQSLVKAHPENAPVLNNAAFFMADTSGDLDEALRLAQNALGKIPGHPGFSDTIGYIYLKKGMLDSAIQTFTNLTRKYPAYASFHYHLGLALYVKGEKDSAKKELEAALADHPSAPDKLRIRNLLDEIS